MVGEVKRFSEIDGLSLTVIFRPLYKITDASVCPSEAFLNSAAHLTFASIRHYISL
jgi:hypothetical protein